jgi:Bacterial archaeo-eukaryotic release factor family 6
MISLPTKTELQTLRSFDEPQCLTIYMASFDQKTASNPSRIVLKNLLRETEAALLAAGTTPKNIKKTLRPAKILLDSNKLWPVHHQSLVLFMHPDLFSYYQLPAQVTTNNLTVQKGFNLEPLDKILQDNKSYFILGLSHNNVQLYRGDNYKLIPVKLKDFPTNMKLALGIDEYPSWRETHSVAPASLGKGSEASHGQYNVSQTDKIMLLQFFRLVDKRLRVFLKNKPAPLVLAGVEYLMPIYRRANTLKNLFPGGIKGNIEHASLDSIRQRARILINKKVTP